MFQFQGAHIFQTCDLWRRIILVYGTGICLSFLTVCKLCGISRCFCSHTAASGTLAAGTAVRDIHAEIQSIFNLVRLGHRCCTAYDFIVGIQLDRDLEGTVFVPLIYRIILVSTCFHIDPFATVECHIRPCLSIFDADLVAGNIKTMRTCST